MALASRPATNQVDPSGGRRHSHTLRRQVAQQALDLYASLIATVDPVERIYVEFSPDAIMMHAIANNISYETRLEVYSAQRKVRDQYPSALWHFTLFDRRDAEDAVLANELVLHRVLNQPVRD